MKRRRDAGAIQAVRLKGDAVRWQQLYYRIEDLVRLEGGGHTGGDHHDTDHDDETAS